MNSSRSRPARVHAFAPILGAKPRLLILGSLPGIASLRAREYYAHPRNQFWPIMQALFGVPADAPYARRVAALRAVGVCVWDVLAEATRPGSADAAIEPATARANGIHQLLLRHRSIAVIAFNGGVAHRLFTRLVLPGIPPRHVAPLEFVTLPSTSPANARLTPAAKRRRWRILLARTLDLDPQCARAAINFMP
ncbi:MAG TPA: DNA-deoxyinosine glycosylase [Steroidobacteraceae bacterium]|nr:DNA-deoxyinosine glycosylase [Steroidobacteraceae bacterium]